MAAVLAGGSAAVLSHRSAAALWGIRQDPRVRVDVTAPTRRGKREGIRFHRSALPADERTSLSGIPVTSVSRTLMDLASTLRRNELARALERAEALRLDDAISLAELLSRHPRRSGAAAIRAILAAGADGATLTRSELENRFLGFLDDFGLPRPLVNASLQAGPGRFEVDCVWPGHRLVVELDGYATHGTGAAFERDRERDRALHVAGWRVIRVTWAQLGNGPQALAADLAVLLGR